MPNNDISTQVKFLPDIQVFWPSFPFSNRLPGMALFWHPSFIFMSREPTADSPDMFLFDLIRQVIFGVDRLKVQIGASCFKRGTSATKLELDMSLLIESSKGLTFLPIRDSSSRDSYEVLGLDFIPQQARDCPPEAKIEISEKPKHYIVRSKLPGVELKNLWVYLEGRTLALYAGVTGERQENGGYRYTKEILGGIRGEATLPKQALRNPVKAKFNDGMLLLVFPKLTDELLDKVVFEDECY